MCVRLRLRVLARVCKTLEWLCRTLHRHSDKWRGQQKRIYKYTQTHTQQHKERGQCSQSLKVVWFCLEVSEIHSKVEFSHPRCFDGESENTPANNIIKYWIWKSCFLQTGERVFHCGEIICFLWSSAYSEEVVSDCIFVVENNEVMTLLLDLVITFRTKNSDVIMALLHVTHIHIHTGLCSCHC